MEFLRKSLIFCLSLVIGIEGYTTQPSMHDWEYELKSLETQSSNTDLVQFYDMSIVRVSRGVYACAGTLFLNYDIVEGDSNEMEMITSYSNNPNRDFGRIPFSMPRKHFFEFMNGFYKNGLMSSLKECSDFPIFEGDFVPPLEKRNYTMNNCIFSKEGFPKHFKDGFYKVDIIVVGDVDWSLHFLLEIERI
ncbi:uncharacterized protein LOC106090368 [Stomoxys calcitrans]|uniref:uncharacterized protein LOC106090368 n=1 Tax=Stomoxys calcitrans TaxID=35570 RepID=UPI0027E27242|nr:uncharacterized protein LOC106090368 [Stomoxys calcitrans]